MVAKKTARGKSGRERGQSLKSSESVGSEPTVLSAEESLQMARKGVHAAMPTIIEAILKKAKLGSCQHAKFLLDFAREQKADAAAKVRAEDEEESLAELLMREIHAAEAEEQVAG